MSAPSDPEKYSIDQMMERLKQRPKSEPADRGQLVTRADGTQALRVRKRKRRTRQPHKEARVRARRARIIQISAALVLLLVVLGMGGTAIIFANSKPFREKLESRIAASTGAAVELKQFRINPTSANAGELVLGWPAGNVMESLTLRGIRAEVFPSTFLGKPMSGEDCSVLETTLRLRFPNADEPAAHQVAALEGDPVRFNRFSSSRFGLVVGDPQQPLMMLARSEASLQPPLGGRPCQLMLNRGDIFVTGLPKYRMDRSHIEFRDGDVDVVSMRVLHESDSQGQLKLSGRFSPYSTEKPAALDVVFDSFLFGGLAASELSGLFSGRITTPAGRATAGQLVFTPGPEPATVLKVDFEGSSSLDFEVGGFQFLKILSRVLEDDWYDRPVFPTQVSGTLVRTEGRTHLDQLQLVNRGRLAIRGSLVLNRDRHLEGTLRVGVPQGMVAASGNKRLEVILSPMEEGFRWVQLKIGGSPGSPTDNFSELYQAAVADEGAAGKDPAPSFEELTRPD
jgi:hypothetical protein